METNSITGHFGVSVVQTIKISWSKKMTAKAPQMSVLGGEQPNYLPTPLFLKFDFLFHPIQTHTPPQPPAICPPQSLAQFKNVYTPDVIFNKFVLQGSQ
jgi:hypothetical protein